VGVVGQQVGERERGFRGQSATFKASGFGVFSARLTSDSGQLARAGDGDKGIALVGFAECSASEVVGSVLRVGFCGQRRLLLSRRFSLLDYSRRYYHPTKPTQQVTVQVN